MDGLGLRESYSYQVERGRGLSDELALKGEYFFEQWRDGKLIGLHPIRNLVTTVGRNYMLDAAFNAASQLSSWYLGLIDATSGTPVPALSDTSASHSGWTEFTTYSEGARQAWTKNAASGSAIANATPGTFTIGTVASGTLLGGGFVISNSTKGGTTGTLWSAGVFPAPVPIATGDIFKLNYGASLT